MRGVRQGHACERVMRGVWCVEDGVRVCVEEEAGWGEDEGKGMAHQGMHGVCSAHTGKLPKPR